MPPLYSKPSFGQVLVQKSRCAPLVLLNKIGVVGINVIDFTALNNFRYSVDMVYVIVAYDDRINSSYPPLV